ncbi:MAG: TatD family hydrolase [Candidatus Levybacteria bacterium]|nr:TatD family hydrolase [Candidatus Levybacteria bacterium]MBI2421024.1 TatD family hydrolase [Candidatus Levybacteria bacterium]
MIDVHCHLNFHAFDKDVDEVIKRAFDKGIKGIINVGTKIDSSQKAVDLIEKHENMWAIVGVHPHHSDKLELEENWLQILEELAKKEKVVAIGEIGLDYFSYKSNGIVDPKLQKETFIKQVELSIKLGLPLQIHNRQAGSDILEILNEYKNNLQEIPGMFHCFAGSRKILKKVLELGFYVGFDGNITYDGMAPGEDTSLSDLAEYTPLDRIVVETDAPFLTPLPHRGSRNVPSYAIITGSFIAKLKKIPYASFAEQTMKNSEAVFDLKLNHD